MARIIDPLDQFFDDSGNPLVDGLLYFYQTGTNTPLDTFEDVNLTIPNTNPLQLTAAGRCPNAYGYNQLYRVVLKTSAGVQIMQRDNVSNGSDGNFTEWNSGKTYAYTDIVLYSNKYYMSASNGNNGNTPDSAAQWIQIRFLNEYEAGFAYSIDDVVNYAGYLYVSATNSNIGNTPTTSHANWQRISNIPHWGANTAYRTYDYAIDSSGGLNKAAANTTGSNPTTPSADWNKIKEHFAYNSAKTYASGNYVYDGEIRYISKQASNTGNQPSADSSQTWWKPAWQDAAELTSVFVLSGGGNLFPYKTYQITDSNTYTLPAASTVPAGGFIIAGKSDTYKAQTPIVQKSGSDTILYNGGADTSITFNAIFTHYLIFKSNGSNQWEI